MGSRTYVARIPDGGRYYLTIDMDGMDPSIAPGRERTGPGRRHVHQARALIHGLVRKGRVVGMDVVEITPKHDVNKITCLTAGRLGSRTWSDRPFARYFCEALTVFFVGNGSCEWTYEARSSRDWQPFSLIYAIQVADRHPARPSAGMAFRPVPSLMRLADRPEWEAYRCAGVPTCLGGRYGRVASD